MVAGETLRLKLSGLTRDIVVLLPLASHYFLNLSRVCLAFVQSFLSELDLNECDSRTLGDLHLFDSDISYPPFLLCTIFHLLKVKDSGNLG